MSKFSLKPPVPPVLKNGKLVWEEEHEEYLKAAFKAGLTTGTEVRTECGGAWRSVPASKITNKIKSLGLKKGKTKGFFLFNFFFFYSTNF